MEVDYPSNHTSGWMPILDLEVQKPMATCYSILDRAAMPTAIEMITLVQRGVTMFRNTRRELHQQLFTPLMEHLAETMMVSGYTEYYSRGVIESAVACYERQVAASDRDNVTLYREIGSHQLGERRSCWHRWPGAGQQTPCSVSPAHKGQTWGVRWWRRSPTGWGSR